MSPINHRLKDVIIALAVAKSYQQDLGRLRLQKFIYLADIIALYWGIINNATGHKTYKNGPYDVDIQNAVDVLAFRGFASITQTNTKEDGSITASYRLTDVGSSLFVSMEGNKLFKRRVSLFNSIGRNIEQNGWANLKALVYLEPTYCFNKVSGWGFRLDYSSLLSNDTLRILDGLKKMIAGENDNYMNEHDFTALYFKLLTAKLHA